MGGVRRIMKNKIIIDGYIIAIGENIGGIEISENEYESLMSKIESRPIPESGFDFVLNANTLEWESVQLSPIDTDTDADIYDYENALSEMGVRFGD